jgi:hypothetical protein
VEPLRRTASKGDARPGLEQRFGHCRAQPTRRAGHHGSHVAEIPHGATLTPPTTGKAKRAQRSCSPEHGNQSYKRSLATSRRDINVAPPTKPCTYVPFGAGSILRKSVIMRWFSGYLICVGPPSLFGAV